MAKVRTSLLRKGLCIVNLFSSFMLLFVKGYTGVNPPLLEDDLPELLDAVAFVGVYFHYHFPSWYRNESVLLQVIEAGNDKLPSWLFFNRSSFSLEGVPLVTDEGFTYLQISARDLLEGASTSNGEKSDVFAINVQFPSIASLKTSFPMNVGNIFAKNSRTQQDEYGIHYCQTYEARFFVSLMLAFSLEKSRAEHRVRIVKSFSDFLSKKPYEIVLSMRSNDVIRRLRGVVVLESKLEPTNNSSRLPPLGDSQMSWYIACDSFTRAEDLSKVLSHNIRSGLLQNVIGHAVLGWSLLAKKPQDKTSSTQRRIRRQVNGFQTPMPTPTLSTTVPSTFRSTPSSSIMQTVDFTPFTTSSLVPMTTSFVPSPVPSFTVPPVVTTVTERISISFTMQTSSVTLVTETPTMTPSTPSTSTFSTSSLMLITQTASVHTTASPTSSSLHTVSSVTESSQKRFTMTQRPVTSSTVTIPSPTVVLQTSVLPSRTTSAIKPSSAVTSLTSSRPEETSSDIPTSSVISLISSMPLTTSYDTISTSSVTSLTPSILLTTSSDIIPPSTVTSITPSIPLTISSDIPTSSVPSLTPSITLATSSDIKPTSTVTSITPSIPLKISSDIPTSSVPSLTPSIPLTTLSDIILTSTVTSLTPSILLKTSSDFISTSTVTFFTSRSLNTAPSVTFTDSLSISVGSSQYILPSATFEFSSFTSSPPVFTSFRQSPTTSIVDTSSSSIKISPSITFSPSDTFSLSVTVTDSVSTLIQSSQLSVISTSMESSLFTSSLPVPTSVRPSLSTTIIASSITSVMTSTIAPVTSEIRSSMLDSSTMGISSSAFMTPSPSTSEIIPSTSSLFPSKTSTVLQPSPTVQSSFVTLNTDTFTLGPTSSSLIFEPTTSIQSSLFSLSLQSSHTPTSISKTVSTLIPMTPSSPVQSSSSYISSTTIPEATSTSFMSSSFPHMSSTSIITPSPSLSSITSKGPFSSSEVISTIVTELFSSPGIQLSSSFPDSSVVSNYFTTSSTKPFISSTTRGSLSSTSLQTSFETSSHIPGFTSFKTPLSQTTVVTVTSQTTPSSFVLTPSTSLHSLLTVRSDDFFTSSTSPSDVFMTLSISPSSSNIATISTRVTDQLSPSLSISRRTTFMPATPSITLTRFTPMISTPITLTSEMLSTPSTSSPNFPTTISKMSSIVTSRRPVYSTQLNMTFQSLSATLFIPSRTTSSVPPTSTIEASPTSSFQVLMLSQSPQISDTPLPSVGVSSSMEQTISVFKSSAISFKLSIPVSDTLLLTYSTSSNIQSSFSLIDSTLTILPSTMILQTSSSMVDPSATVGSSSVSSEIIFSTMGPVSMTISPSLSSDKMSPSQLSSLERTIFASSSTLMSSSEGRIIPSSMLTMESVLSSSRTRSIVPSTNILPTHFVPSLTLSVSSTSSTKISLFSSIKPSSLSATITPPSSTSVENSVSRLQSSSEVTSGIAVTTKTSKSSSTTQTLSTPLPSPSSVSVQSSSTSVTTSHLPSLTLGTVPTVSSIITTSFSSYISPSSVASSSQMKTSSMSTPEVVTTPAITMTSTITKSSSTVRTPPLTTTPAITSSPLMSPSATTVSLTTLSSMLPSLSLTGIIKATSSFSSLLFPSPTPSSTVNDMVSSSPVIGTTSSGTTEEPTTGALLTTAPRDHKPDLLNPVDYISYRAGTVFEYQIPPDTFFDKEDGSTPHLSLSLLGEDYQSVDSSSWIQLDEDEQVLFGVVISNLSVSKLYQFFLAATDSSGGAAYDSFKVEIFPNEIDYSHQYTIVLNNNFLQFTENSRNLFNFCRNLVRYHKDSLSSLNVQAVSNGSVTVTYSNNSIPVSFCDLHSIEAVLQQMIYANGSLVPEFQSEIGKLFPVLNVSVRFLGKCAGVATTKPPVIPKSPQIGNSTVFIALVIGFCLIFILVLIGCLLCLYCTKKRPGEEYLLAEEKVVYTKNRKPVILNNDRDVLKHPRRTYPAVLPDDISPFKSERKVTPPIKSVPPPSYKPFPSHDNFLELGDFRHFPQGNPPPGYSPSPTSQLPTRQDPPEYQQPPPYFPSQKNSDNGKFQTTHF